MAGDDLVSWDTAVAEAKSSRQVQMKDSGERQQFETGAVRDAAADKPRIDLISPFAKRRLGHWLLLGAKKYAERNWEAGIPISRCIASLERHLAAYQAGENDEDHLAAVMCNAMFAIHNEEMVKRGVLPESISDMPDYGKAKPRRTEAELDSLVELVRKS